MKKLLFLIFFLNFYTAQASTGYIDTSAADTAQVCYDPTCTSPTPSTINFKLSQQPSIVVDSVTGITGYVWGNALGWINMHPTGGGVTFTDSTSGVLTGKAWSQVSGWINFTVTGQQVVIGPTTGEFSGFAWTGGPNGGWLKFDCTNASSCVKTTWRAPINHGGHAFTTASSIDVCENIPGDQTSIPSGYTVAVDGGCIPVTDACPNIPGDQDVIPKGFIKDIIGACVLLFDYCPNITGVQTSLPTATILDTKGKCVSIQKNENEAIDVCINIPGTQPAVPTGYVSEENLCYPAVLDVCKNIDGNQPTVPNNKIIDRQGNCTDALIDLCSNLSGSQEVVPARFHLENGLCLFDDATNIVYPDVPKIVGYSFVPDALKIPSSNPILKKTVGALLGKKGDFKVDAVSVVVTIAVLPVSIVLIMKLMLKRFL